MPQRLTLEELREYDRCLHVNLYSAPADTLQYFGDPLVVGPGSWLTIPLQPWYCPYCGSNNNAEREECRGCRAPRPKEE